MKNKDLWMPVLEELYNETKIKKDEERTKQQIILPSISKLQKGEYDSIKYYKIYQELKDKGFGDIAIYVGLALAQTKLKPKWSIEDIISEIEDPTLVEESFQKYLKKEYEGKESDVEKKEIAINIWKQIIEGERKQHINVSRVLDEKTKKEDNKENNNFDSKKFKEVINSALEDLGDISKSMDPDGFQKELEKIAKKYIKEVKGLKEYIIKEEQLGKEADEDDAATELVGILASKL